MKKILKKVFGIHPKTIVATLLLSAVLFLLFASNPWGELVNETVKNPFKDVSVWKIFGGGFFLILVAAVINALFFFQKKLGEGGIVEKSATLKKFIWIIVGVLTLLFITYVIHLLVTEAVVPTDWVNKIKGFNDVPVTVVPYLVFVPLMFSFSYYMGDKNYYKNLPRATIVAVITTVVLTFLIYPNVAVHVFEPIGSPRFFEGAYTNGSSGMVILFVIVAVYFLWKGSPIAAGVTLLAMLYILSKKIC